MQPNAVAGYGNQIGGYATAQDATKQIGAVDALDGELTVSLKMIHELHAMAKNSCDRLMGTQPESVQKARDNPTPSSQLGRLETTAGYNRESLNDLRATIVRLDRL